MAPLVIWLNHRGVEVHTHFPIDPLCFDTSNLVKCLFASFLSSVFYYLPVFAHLYLHFRFGPAFRKVERKREHLEISRILETCLQTDSANGLTD